MSPTLLWIALGAAVLFLVPRVMRQRAGAKRMAEFRRHWGQSRETRRDLDAIAAYHRARAAAQPDRGWLDDRSWADFDMDGVFAALDRAASVVGQQGLYHRLRASPKGAHLDAFEALVARFSGDAAARDRAYLALAPLGAPGAADLWCLAEPGALVTEPWHAMFPIATVLMVTTAIAAAFWPPAILLLIVGSIGNPIARSRIAWQLRVVAGAFRHLGPLVAAAQTLGAEADSKDAAITGMLKDDARRLGTLKRIAAWSGRDSSGAVFGEPSAALFEYLNMIFWLDANAVLFGSRELRAKADVLHRLIAAIGDIDAALAVASYRAGTPGWVRPHLSSSGPTVITGMRHPLLPGAVPNSIATPPNGLIITGSNMSGKTTFLRTAGATVVLAQTVNTCLADRFEAPVRRVRSCIGVADDPAAGKSYYLVEVESVLAMVQAARSDVAHLLLFDELFRGTNAVERIGAGTAVLRALVAPEAAGRESRHLVLAATHDRELVELVGDRYAAHHFPDTVDANGLSFSYTLEPGPATTRNAIAVLQQRGAPADLVADATAIADALDRARRSGGLHADGLTARSDAR